MNKRKIYLSDDLRVFKFPGTDVTDGLVSTLETWISRLNESDRHGLQRIALEAGKGGGGYPDWSKGLAALVELSMRKLEEHRDEIPETAQARCGRPRLPKRKFKWILSCWMNRERRKLLLDWQEMCGAETDGMAMLIWMDVMSGEGAFGVGAPRLPRNCTFDLEQHVRQSMEDLKRQVDEASARLA